MNEHRLLLALGDVDDKYIEEASICENVQAFKKRTVPVRWIAAACLICVLAAALAVLPQMSNNDADVTLSNNTTLKFDKLTDSDLHFDHSITPPDSEDENKLPENTNAEPLEVIYAQYTEPNFGTGSSQYGSFCKGTYIFKDYKSEITIPQCPDMSKTEELYVYKRGIVVGKDALKQRCEEFLEYAGIDIEACITTEATDDVYQVHVPTGKGLKVEGTIMDSFSGSAMVIRSLGTGITVGYVSDTEIKPADLEFVKQYIKEDPIIAAACAYSGITEPELLYRRDYNIYGEQYGYYYICSAEDDAYTIAKRAIYLSFGDDNGVTLGINDQSYFKQDSACALKTKEDAVGAFCAENGIDPDSILESGFAYIYRENPVYIPYYLILVPGDNEFIKTSEMDLSVYQEYDLLAIPAIEIP